MSERDIERDQEFEERMLSKRIKASSTAQPEAEAVGKCLNCGQRLRHKLRWCDEDCRDDWQYRRDRRST